MFGFGVSKCCLAFVLVVLSVACACDRAQSDPAPGATPSAEPAHGVLLRGSFERVAKKASGTVEIVRSGADYQLRLRGVSVDTASEVHVYLVGLPEAKTTLALTATETKYDFGPLDNGVPEQVIRLPSEPAPELRSVVLYEPRFGVNLAAASLR